MLLRLSFFLLVLLYSTFGFAQTSLSGKVIEKDGEPLILGNIVLYQDGALINGTETDFDGNYTINNLLPGTYDVEVSYIGYATYRITGLVIFAGKANSLDVQMPEENPMNYIPICISHYIPIVQQDNTTSGATISNIKRGRAQFSFTVGW